MDFYDAYDRAFAQLVRDFADLENRAFQKGETMGVKRFDDLTDAEVLALTEPEIKRWIDVECAFMGAPLLPPEPVKPEPVDFTTDVEAYQIGDFIFLDPTEAAKLLSFLNAVKVYKPEYVACPGYKRKLVPAQEIKIETQAFFSAARWDAIKADAEAASRRDTLYYAELREYEAAVKGRAGIAQQVNARVERVNRDERTRQRMRADFDRYLDLSSGSRVIALRFLKNAWGAENDLLIQTFPDVAEPEVGPAFLRPGSEA